MPKVSKVTIIGLGPVGLMLALWLLANAVVVTAYEGRQFTREQIVYLLPKFWSRVPYSVKDALRKNGGVCLNDVHPLICDVGTNVNVKLASFQCAMLDFLVKNYPDFTLIRKNVNVEEVLGDGVIIVADGGHPSSVIHGLWKLLGPLLGRAHPYPYRSIPVSNAAVITFQTKFDSKVALANSDLFERNQKAFVAFRTARDRGYFATQLSKASFDKLDAHRQCSCAPNSMRYHHNRHFLAEYDDEHSQHMDHTQHLMDEYLETPEGKLYLHVMERSGFYDVAREAIQVFPIQLRTAARFHFELPSSEHWWGKLKLAPKSPASKSPASKSAASKSAAPRSPSNRLVVPRSPVSKSPVSKSPVSKSAANKSAAHTPFNRSPTPSRPATHGSNAPGTHVFIVGDVAFNAHFFTGMGANSGMKCAMALADLLLNEPEEMWSHYNSLVKSVRDELWDQKTPPVLIDLDGAIDSGHAEPLDLLHLAGNPSVEKNIQTRNYLSRTGEDNK